MQIQKWKKKKVIYVPRQVKTSHNNTRHMTNIWFHKKLNEEMMHLHISRAILLPNNNLPV